MIKHYTIYEAMTVSANVLAVGAVRIISNNNYI